MKNKLTMVQAELARRDLAIFIKGAWKVVEPGTAYLHNWHIDYIAEYLLAITTGEIKRAIFNIAPRHMKSRLITTMWPVWEWIEEPHLRYLFSSYALELSRDHSRERRTIIESDWYQDRWGERFKLTDDQNQVTNFANNKGGRMQSRGTGGAGTGKGGNRVIIDDPHNTKQAESQPQREAAITDFRQNLSTRLDNPKEDAIVLVMQRLNDDDLTGYILSEIGGYEHIKIPSVAKKRTVITYPRSGKEIVREKDDLLWEERMGQKEIAAAKKTLGTYGFEAQHEQDPTIKGGNRIKMKWFPRYRMAPAAPQRCIQSWDTGNKPKDTAAPSVCETFIYDGEKWLLVDVWRDQVGYPDLKQAVYNLNAKWNPQAVLIEDKASGISLLQDTPGVPTIAIEPEADKFTRMETQSPFVEAGMIALPYEAPWLPEFELEITRYPNPATWDQIDTLSQFLKYIFGKKEGVKMQKFKGG